MLCSRHAGGKTGSLRFERKERLKGRSEIREVFNRGRRFAYRPASGGGNTKLFMLENKLPWNRICFTFPRGFGNAVERNRAKRLGREAYRLLRNRLSCGYDLVLLTFADAPDKAAKVPKSLTSCIGQLEFLFAKAGLLR